MGRKRHIFQQTPHCLVCGDICKGKNFGVLTCLACAAFFRKTISTGQVYKCRKLGKCTFDKTRRNVCRYCRLKKCTAVGMMEELVRNREDECVKNGNKTTDHKDEEKNKIEQKIGYTNPGSNKTNISEEVDGEIVGEFIDEEEEEMENENWKINKNEGEKAIKILLMELQKRKIRQKRQESEDKDEEKDKMDDEEGEENLLGLYKKMQICRRQNLNKFLEEIRFDEIPSLEHFLEEGEKGNGLFARIECLAPMKHKLTRMEYTNVINQLSIVPRFGRHLWIFDQIIFAELIKQFDFFQKLSIEDKVSLFNYVQFPAILLICAYFSSKSANDKQMMELTNAKGVSPKWIYESECYKNDGKVKQLCSVAYDGLMDMMKRLNLLPIEFTSILALTIAHFSTPNLSICGRGQIHAFSTKMGSKLFKVLETQFQRNDAVCRYMDTMDLISAAFEAANVQLELEIHVDLHYLLDPSLADAKMPKALKSASIHLVASKQNDDSQKQTVTKPINDDNNDNIYSVCAQNFKSAKITKDDDYVNLVPQMEIANDVNAKCDGQITNKNNWTNFFIWQNNKNDRWHQSRNHASYANQNEQQQYYRAGCNGIQQFPQHPTAATLKQPSTPLDLYNASRMNGDGINNNNASDERKQHFLGDSAEINWLELLNFEHEKQNLMLTMNSGNNKNYYNYFY